MITRPPETGGVVVPVRTRTVAVTGAASASPGATSGSTQPRPGRRARPARTGPGTRTGSETSAASSHVPPARRSSVHATVSVSVPAVSDVNAYAGRRSIVVGVSASPGGPVTTNDAGSGLPPSPIPDSSMTMAT